MRVLICGSQDWTDPLPIRERIEWRLNPKRDIVIHGGCPGADLIAKAEANLRGIHDANVRPLWDFYKRGAGHVRNAVMVTMLAPDEVWAFSLGTPGTQGTIDAAREAGIPVHVIGREAVAA